MCQTRYVTCVKKASDGDIIAIGNPLSWGTINKSQAISDIETQKYEYIVDWGDYSTVIKVVSNGYIKYLNSFRDSSLRNNLENLPECLSS